MAVLAKDSKECEEKAASENDEKKAKFSAIMCARKMQKRLAQVEGVTVADSRVRVLVAAARELKKAERSRENDSSATLEPL